MPTPIGHALAGYAAARLTRVHLARDERRLFLWAAFFAILPDLLGLALERLTGEPNHGFSHSLAALVVVSVAVAAMAWRRGSRFAPMLLLVAATYGSHLLADLLRPAATAEAGEELLWPLRTAFALDINVFPHVPERWEVGGTAGWLRIVLSLGLREAIILVPVALLARLIRPVVSARPPAGVESPADPAAAA